MAGPRLVSRPHCPQLVNMPLCPSPRQLPASTSSPVGPAACLAVKWCHCSRGLLTPVPPEGSPRPSRRSLRVGIEKLKMEKTLSQERFCKPHVPFPSSSPEAQFPFLFLLGACRVAGRPLHHTRSESPPGRRRQSSLWTPGMR